MEILCKSEYQNVYRVKDGVLFVVNKFKYIKNKKGYMYHLSNIDRKNSKTYKKGCKDLKILTKKYKSNGVCFDVGQVIYQHYPVELTDKNEWEFQIKTTGEYFSGNTEEMNLYLHYLNKLIN